MKKILFGLLALLLVATVTAPSVSAATQTKKTEQFVQATVSWKSIQGAASYNVLYKASKDKKWTHAVRDLPANTTSVTIKHLKKGVTYWYVINALNTAKKVIWTSGNHKLMPTTAMR